MPLDRRTRRGASKPADHARRAVELLVQDDVLRAGLDEGCLDDVGELGFAARWTPDLEKTGRPLRNLLRVDRAARSISVADPSLEPSSTIINSKCGKDCARILPIAAAT